MIDRSRTPRASQNGGGKQGICRSSNFSSWLFLARVQEPKVTAKERKERWEAKAKAPSRGTESCWKHFPVRGQEWRSLCVFQNNMRPDPNCAVKIVAQFAVLVAGLTMSAAAFKPSFPVTLCAAVYRYIISACLFSARSRRRKTRGAGSAHPSGCVGSAPRGVAPSTSLDLVQDCMDTHTVLAGPSVGHSGEHWLFQRL